MTYHFPERHIDDFDVHHLLDNDENLQAMFTWLVQHKF